MIRVGVIANPQSGKDIRRLVALATSFSNHEKLLIVRRVLAGLEAAGVDEVAILDDAGSLGRAAVEAFGKGSAGKRTKVRLCSVEARGESEDTTRAASKMTEEGAACIVVLGGDGTSRAAAKGCGRCPLVPLSTGTNNAFSQNWEGTVAGLGAGLYAMRPRRYSKEVAVSKRLVVHLKGGKDIALVDLAIINESFAGSRAVWDTERIHALALTRCEPGGLGLSALGAGLDPITTDEPEGLWIEFAPRGAKGKTILSPVGPGLLQQARVGRVRRIAPGERVEITSEGNQVLAFDGEREYVLSSGEGFEVELDSKGPRVLNIPSVLKIAAQRGHLSNL
ncbi:MAG: ATP-NAD kinase [Nitrospinaceae bacterium]|nr:ATP-NAD kinase [Nitrospinaceae bacterium]